MELINVNKLKVGTKLYLADGEPYAVALISPHTIYLNKLTPEPSEYFSTNLEGLYPFLYAGFYGVLIKDLKPITKIDKHLFV